MGTESMKTEPAWKRRRANACDNAVNELQDKKRNRSEEAAYRFFEKYGEVSKSSPNVNEAPGNKKLIISERAIAAGAEAIGLSVIYEPLFKLNDDFEKHLDLLIYRGENTDKRVAIECKASAEFNYVAAALMEFYSIRKLGLYDKAGKHGNKIPVSLQNTHFIMVCAGNAQQTTGWFDKLNGLLFSEEHTKKQSCVCLFDKSFVDDDAKCVEEVIDRVVKLFRNIDSHLK